MHVPLRLSELLSLSAQQRPAQRQWASPGQPFISSSPERRSKAAGQRSPIEPKNKRRAEIALDAAKVPTPQRTGQRMAQERCSTPSLACRPRVPYRLARWASRGHGFTHTAEGTNRELKAPRRQRSESEFFSVLCGRKKKCRRHSYIGTGYMIKLTRYTESSYGDSQTCAALPEPRKESEAYRRPP